MTLGSLRFIVCYGVGSYFTLLLFFFIRVVSVKRFTFFVKRLGFEYSQEGGNLATMSRQGGRRKDAGFKRLMG